MVGHLGAAPLAGLGLASAVLQTIIGLMIFLAYATTPRSRAGSARATSAGRSHPASTGCGSRSGSARVLAVAGWLAAPWLVGAFRRVRRGDAEASVYLSISMAGLPAMLVVFAATGLLRGLQDTRTPLWVAGLGFTANIALNAVFIYGLGWGIAGSAIGTVVAAVGHGARLRRGDRAARRARRREPVAAPRGRAARREVGRLAVPAHAEPAGRAAARDVGRDLARPRRARGLPGGDHDLLHARVRARRTRDRGAGAHRQGARCGRRRAGARGAAPLRRMGHRRGRR